MNREIKFRGKDIKGQWWYGSLVQSSPHRDGSCTCWIKENDFMGIAGSLVPSALFHEVDPKTVGQYIGEHDKEVIWIYEGDILKVGDFIDGDEEEPGICLDDSIQVVEWFGAGYPAFDIKPGLSHECNGLAEIMQGDYMKCQIIGNVHDHPELIK